jgi:hypothetical protein
MRKLREFLVLWLNELRYRRKQKQNQKQDPYIYK